MSQTYILTDVIRQWSEVFMRRSMRDFKRFMDTSGLSYSQVNILMRLAYRGSCSVSEIGEQLGVTNPAASQAVDRLVVSGLIERREDSEDRRTKRLALTQRGHDTIKQVIDARSRWIQGIPDILNSDQQKMIITSLTMLIEAAQKTND